MEQNNGIEEELPCEKTDSPSSYDVVNKRDLNYYTDVSLKCRNTPQSSPLTAAATSKPSLAAVARRFRARVALPQLRSTARPRLLLVLRELLG